MPPRENKRMARGEPGPLSPTLPFLNRPSRVKTARFRRGSEESRREEEVGEVVGEEEGGEGVRGSNRSEGENGSETVGR
jgi:hypothetical protein